MRGAPQGAADVEEGNSGSKLKGLFGRLFANKNKIKEDHDHAQVDAGDGARYCRDSARVLSHPPPANILKSHIYSKLVVG